MAKQQKSDPILEKVKKRFNSSRDYTKKYFSDTWDENWKLYNNQRVMAAYDGSSDGFVPETFTILQAVKAHVVGPNLKVEFLPRQPGQRGDTKTLNSMFDFVSDQDHTAMKTDFAVQDMLVTGNGYLFQSVCPYDTYALPENKYIPTEDTFFDPQAKDYDELRYCGYRYLTTLTELKSEMITNPDYDEKDPKSQAKMPRYKNLDQVVPGFSDKDDKTAKSLREEMLGGTTLNDKNDLVECIYYVDKEKIVTVANRETVIEEAETPFKRDKKMVQSVDDQGQPVSFELPAIEPFLPVAPFRDYIDGAMFYARSEIDIIKELQERLNDTQNQKTDNLSFIMNRMWALDPAYSQKIDEIQNIPGAVFTVPPGALEQIQTQPIGADADVEINRIKDEMRRATAADELIQGAQQTNGSITATEVNAQLTQAGTRFSLKLNFLENEGFRIMAENMFKLMQIYITQEVAIRWIGPEGVQWKNYNPGEFLGDYDVKVQLKSTATRMKEEEKQNAMQFFLLASKLGFVNQQALFKDVVMTLFNKDADQVEALMQPINPSMRVAEKMIETLDYKDAPPDVQAEMEAQIGLQPSAVHDLQLKALGLPPTQPPQPQMPQPGQGPIQGPTPGMPGAGGGPAQGVNVPSIPQGPAR